MGSQLSTGPSTPQTVAIQHNASENDSHDRHLNLNENYVQTARGSEKPAISQHQNKGYAMQETLAFRQKQSKIFRYSGRYVALRSGELPGRIRTLAPGFIAVSSKAFFSQCQTKGHPQRLTLHRIASP